MRVICLLCLSTAQPVCSCGNAASILDTDGHLHIYVDQIATTRLANVYYLGGVETYRELLDPFDTALYLKYRPLHEQHLNFQPYSRKNDYVRKTIDPFDRQLMAALNRYITTTASPGRMGSTKQQPDKRKHT